LTSHTDEAGLILHAGFGFSATLFAFSCSFNAKENALFNLTNILLTIGAFALISGVATVVRSYRWNRREEAAPFLHYFEPEYDRNLFPQDSWCEHEDLYYRHTRVTAIRDRDSSAAEMYSKGNSTTRPE
jgi:hypothetical protein